MVKSVTLFTVALIFCLLSSIFAACDQGRNDAKNTGSSVLRLATTTSTVDSGLLDVLLPVFEGKHMVIVQIFALGTSKALRLGAEGGADVVLVHNREAEDKFIVEGYGVNRRDVMYNEFIILGPPDDPLRIKDEHDVLEALRKIAQGSGPFVSRADRSGTHLREIHLWKLAGVETHGDWYIETSKGMLTTLQIASARQAYVLTDQSTYLFNKDKLNLAVILEGDKRLFNHYGIIAVNPTKISGVNFKEAMQLIHFVTIAEGRKIIATYGMKRFGRPLFYPSIQDY